MLSPVDAPVSEFKRRGINVENVSQFEARKFAFMFAMNKLGIIAAEIIHIGEAKATCLLRTNSDKVAKS